MTLMRSGAISRLNEINDASPEVVRQFCVYAKYIVELQERAIDSKESPIIIEFLNLCEQNQIKLTDSEIEDLAQHCVDLFDANFNSKWSILAGLSHRYSQCMDS
jgi:hypothetical protein